MKRFDRLLFVLAGVGSGCMQLQDLRLESQQRRMARSAWTSSGSGYCHVAHSIDFQKGYEDGYYDLASGGDGCPPALPPKKYWGAAYQTPGGQEHAKAWFAGFREGVEAAKRSGVSSYSSIYVSPEHRRAWSQDAVPNQNMTNPGLVPTPANGTGVAPVPTTGTQPAVGPNNKQPVPLKFLPPAGYQPPPNAQAPDPLLPPPVIPRSGSESTPPTPPPMKPTMAAASAQSSAPTPMTSMVLPSAIGPKVATQTTPAQAPTSSMAFAPKPMDASMSQVVMPPPFMATTVASDFQPPPPPVAMPKQAGLVQPKPVMATVTTEPSGMGASVVAREPMPMSTTSMKPITPPAGVEWRRNDWQPKMPAPMIDAKVLDNPAQASQATIDPLPAVAPTKTTPTVALPTASTSTVVPNRPEKATEPTGVKTASATEVGESRETPAAKFVKPSADLPEGFLPEVQLGKPRPLNPDGTFVK